MKIQTLKTQKDFDRVFFQKHSFGNRHFTLLYCQNGLNNNRIGIIISKKISKKAVCRNKLRRQIKEIFRQHQDLIQSGLDLIIIPKKRCLQDSYSELQRSFIHLFYKQSLLKNKVEK